MARALGEVTEADELLAQIAALRDQQADVAATIREQAVRAVRELGAQRITTAAAAGISRPTLNAWLDN